MAATMKSVFWELRNDLGQRVRKVRQNQTEKLKYKNINSKYSNAAPRRHREGITKKGKLSLHIMESNNQNQRSFGFPRDLRIQIWPRALDPNIRSQIFGWIVDLVCDRPLGWLLITTSTEKSNKGIYYLFIFIKISHRWISFITWVCYVCDSHWSIVHTCCWGTCGGDKHLCADLHS